MGSEVGLDQRFSGVELVDIYVCLVTGCLVFFYLFFCF